MVDMLTTVSRWVDPNSEATFAAAARRAAWQARQTAVYAHVPMAGSGTSMSQARDAAVRGNTRARLPLGTAGSAGRASQTRLDTEWEQALSDALALAGQ